MREDDADNVRRAEHLVDWRGVL